MAKFKDSAEKLKEKIIVSGHDRNRVQKRSIQASLKEAGRKVSDPLIDMEFSDYRIVSRLGQGSMATVYEGYDLTEYKRVAIKILHSHLTTLPQALARFQQEYKSTRLVNHPNAVTVYDSGILNGRPFLVMEFIDGTSLADVIRTNGSVEPTFLLDILIQVCAALSAAHEKGVIHRDLKPANILLSLKPTAGIKVKLVDFGIAQVLPNLGETHFRCTQYGEMLGSLLYMSPEQCLEHDIDKRSDVYSLGCLFYEALTGTPPMAGRTAFETINKHLSAAPKPISEVCPNLEIPDGMEIVILKALEKKPGDRFQSIDAMQKELELLRGGKLPILVRARRAEMDSKAKSNSQLLFMLISAILAIVAVIAWQLVVLQSPAPVQQSQTIQQPVEQQTPADVRQSPPVQEILPVAAKTRGCDGLDGMDGDTPIALVDINPSEDEEKVLLSPSARDFAHYGPFLKSPDTGLIRLLPREKYEGKLRVNGSGAYYSFAHRAQEYGYGSDIELQNNNFKVGFAGNDFGYLTILGDKPLKSVDLNTPAVRILNGSIPDEAAQPSRVMQNGKFLFSYRVPAHINTTYVLRSVNSGRSDVLIAFRPVRKDKDGSMIILWKMLKAYPILPL